MKRIALVTLAAGPLLFALAAAAPMAQEAKAGTPAEALVPGDASTAPELGPLPWRRGYDAALLEARRAHKPVLVLFDEVPGCDTVKGYGAGVLSHPLLVDAVAAAFVPVLVQNNASGDDARVLRSFREPAWNNPVVRLVDDAGRALSPRVTHDVGLLGLAEALQRALVDQGAPVPRSLSLLLEEEQGRAVAQDATFGMWCFWSGEAALGSEAGVLSTEPGFAGGGEAVRVRFDPRRFDVQKVARRHELTVVDGAGFRGAPRDALHALSPALKALPMTPLQATRVNATVAAGGDPTPLLTRAQLLLLGAGVRTR